MPLFCREKDMVDVFCRILVGQGYEVFREVAYYGRRIDVLAVFEDQFWAYEAKLTQWPRALDQAHWHVTAVDYSSVVLPLPLAKRVEHQIFRTYQIGLVGLSEDTWFPLVEPVTSPLNWPPAKEQLARTVQSFRNTRNSLCIL